MESEMGEKKSGPIDGRLPTISSSFGSRFGSNLYIHINLEPKMWM